MPRADEIRSLLGGSVGRIASCGGTLISNKEIAVKVFVAEVEILRKRGCA
jgi:hypothetical protein